MKAASKQFTAEFLILTSGGLCVNVQPVRSDGGASLINEPLCSQSLGVDHGSALKISFTQAPIGRISLVNGDFGWRTLQLTALFTFTCY